jgi:soluble lytic murein transglycosylase
MALAEAHQAAGGLPEAVAAYQFVYTQYPVSDAAEAAEAALLSLRDKMGAAYPQLTPRQALERASRFLALREHVRARSEFRKLVAQLPPGIERDTARVRLGAVDYRTGSVSGAYQYLRRLDVPVCEADAERLYYLTESARQLNDEDEMMDFVKRLGRTYPKSPWRFKALITAANDYLVINKPDQYVPLYKAAYENFPTETLAPVCHWKVAFHSYVHRKHDARHRLRNHLELFSGHSTAGAALYFLGRLAERSNDWGGARAYYDKLTGRFPNYYYAVLARDRLKDSRLADAAPGRDTDQYLAALPFTYRAPQLSQPTRATTMRIERARLLRSAGLDNWAESEIRFGAKTDGQGPLLAVELARTAETPFERLRTMKSVSLDYLTVPFEEVGGKFWEYLFPLPYQSDVVRNARAHNLDPFMVAALIRQESEFNPQALSRARAYGLTQVMPSTGRALARKVGIRRFSNRMLFQPSTNLKLGTYYLRSMLDKWDGRWEHTLASYNAGPNRVAEWITWNHCEEPAEFVESIPFTETREYVQAVLRNAALYRRIYEDRPPAVETQVTKAAAKPAPKVSSSSKSKSKAPARKTSTKKPARR